MTFENGTFDFEIYCNMCDSDKYELEFYKSQINQTYEVVTELKKNNTCIGHTTNYIPVTLNEKLNNEIVNVKITDVKAIDKVYGIVEK